MNGFLDVEAIMVPQSIIDDGQKFLRAAGVLGREGMVLWVGKKKNTTFYVTDLVIPHQRGIRTSDGVCVIVEGDELARLNMALYKNQLQLIAQVHSHPSEAYHSNMDDEYAIATKVGCLSLVVPDFAAQSFSLAQTAIYRLSNQGEWLDISESSSDLIYITKEAGYSGAR